MKITAKSGAALAAAAAAVVIGAALPAVAGANYTVKCYGLNACKGNGSCKSLGNSCKGQNACKGQGIKMLSKSACVAKGGKTSRS
jgi:uncharacterized membrane protein